MRFDDFANKCNSLQSEMRFEYKSIAPSIEFSNTGRRGGRKYFSITLISLISVLKDIRDNLNSFSSQTHYVESVWRNLFSTHLTDAAVNALSTVQTLPLFTAIAKIIHVVNTPTDTYHDSSISLNEAYLTTAINYLESQIPDEEIYFSKQTPHPVLTAAGKGENVIYYGAPGTGKSHTIDKEINESNTVRTVFHAETQNSDFIGCLKPITDGDSIKYEFRPGPFTNAVINAANDPEYQHWLVIEEINRAPAAAVFGEIFQLLDRDSETGESRYSITLSDLDMQHFISGEANTAIQNDKLKIPGNLTILATMNSSDQAVMPLDTAFKRRWKFKYIPLDFDSSYKNLGSHCAQGNLLITDQNDVEATISWKTFATAINKILSSNGIPEDRHLGPFFLSDNELNEENNKEALTGKLFMYLWDDVLRHGMTVAVFDENIKTYGELTRRYEKNQKVFNDRFYELVKGQLQTVAVIPYKQNTVDNLRAVAEDIPDYAPEE